MLATTPLVHTPKHSLVSQAVAGMRNFDAEFTDLNQYIRVITDRIWEQRRIDDIHAYYSDPCIVETPSSVSTSLQTVIDGTRATLGAFPDRRLLAEDVIQSGDDVGGYLSSHRIISPMTHLGSGAFGAPTGKAIQVRTIADCVCKDNKIIHEWLVRDVGAIALQIGSTPQALAQRWLDERHANGITALKPAAGSAPHGYVSHISKLALPQAYAQALDNFANGNFQAHSLYDEAVHQLGSNASSHYGHEATLAYWQNLFTALPAQSFTVEHLAMQTGDDRPTRTAMRWRAQCLHTGIGKFGLATGKPVEIMGISHAEWHKGKVLREWVLIDEVALWMQILNSTQLSKQ